MASSFYEVIWRAIEIRVRGDLQLTDENNLQEGVVLLYHCFWKFFWEMNDFEAFMVQIIVICVINFYSEIRLVWVYQIVARVHLVVFLRGV